MSNRKFLKSLKKQNNGVVFVRNGKDYQKAKKLLGKRAKIGRLDWQ